MSRSPLVAAAVLAAGLVMAACGAAPAGHAGGTPKASPTPWWDATPKPSAAVVVAEQGFRSWAEASGILTGPRPASAGPAAEQDLLVLGTAFALPGWLAAVGKGLVLTETPAGCQASIQHVEGSFPAPASAPTVAGAGKTALVVAFYGVCVTSAAGVKYVVEPASDAPRASGTYVLLGSTVPLPPVAGLPSLPKSVWSPVFVATCQSGWVQGAGSNLPGGTVPGC
jgi:hypothetical protein